MSKYIKRNRLYSEITDNENAPWFRDLLISERIIEELQDNPFYKSSYQNQEALFWLNIPKWIYDDNTNNSIKSFLDIGCAYGTLIHYVKSNFKSDAFAMDIIDSVFPSSLSTEWGINFKLGDIENGSIPWDIKFDRIIFTEVVEHLLNPLKALRKINKALSKDGKLFLSTPDAKEWGRVNKYYCSIEEIVSNPKKNVRVDGHVYQYDDYEIRYLLEAGGFEIEKINFSPGACDRHFNIVATKAQNI